MTILWAFFCADVSGKGMSAALMMAHLQAVAHGRMLLLEPPSARPSPSALAAMLNRDLCGRFGDNRYATMFYGEYDSSTRLLRYINAGNCPPILISDNGEVTVLRDGDLPIGLFTETTYQELGLTFSRGDAIVVYSDGLIDALNLQGTEFGEERLCELLQAYADGNICRVDLLILVATRCGMVGGCGTIRRYHPCCVDCGLNAYLFQQSPHFEGGRAKSPRKRTTSC